MAYQVPDSVSRLVSLASNRQLPNGWSFLVDMENMFQLHCQTMIENWYMYYGLHNLFLQRFEGEDDATFAKRVTNSTVENHIKFIINTISSYLYADQDSITRYVERNDQVDSTLIKFLKTTSWNHNKFNTIDVGKALNALVTGYTIVQRNLYDVRTDKPFGLLTSQTEKAEYGYIKKKLIDSTKAIPFPYIDSDGAVHEDRLGAIVFMTSNENYIGIPDLARLLNKQSAKIQIMEYVDDTYWFKWTRGINDREWQQVTVNAGTQYQNKNPFGDVSVLFTVYKNFGDPFQLIGNSEVADLRSLNLEVDELGNADKETVRYHSFPIMVAYNFDMPKNFVRTKNAVIEVNKPHDKSKLEYLTWEGVLTESRERQETCRRNMSSVNGVSLITRGFLKDIGQIRSGPPLKALFSSDKTSMSLRFTAFEEKEAEDMKADVRFFQTITGVDFNLNKDVVFKAKFNRDFLGLDALLEAQIDQLKAQSTEDLFTLIKEEHPELTDAEINQRVKDFQKEHQPQKPSGPLTSAPEVKASQQAQ